MIRKINKYVMFNPIKGYVANPYKGFVSFNHFRGDPLFSDCATSDGWKKERYPLSEGLEENGEDFGGAALAFYEHLNDMDADFLDEHDYSREEVSLGIKNVARVLGCESVANALM